MPIKTLFFAIFCLLLPALGLAQCYTELLQKGNTAMQNKNYNVAIQKYQGAKECHGVSADQKKHLDALIAKARAAQKPVTKSEKPKNPPPTVRKQPELQPAPARIISDPFAGTMIRVEGGTFTMGCQDGRDKNCDEVEKSSHTVSVSSFSICKYEVTQAQWRAVMGENPSYFKNCDNCPVEQVSYNDIQKFLKKLNAGGWAYRLPTEAEWEYAARGGNKSRGYNYSGSNNIDAVAWYKNNSANKTHSVGSKKSNELGLYDMSGNVWEWCTDWYKGYTESVGVSDLTGYNIAIHGGSWFSVARFCRPSYRRYSSKSLNYYYLGFRLASQ